MKCQNKPKRRPIGLTIQTNHDLGHSEADGSPTTTTTSSEAQQILPLELEAAEPRQEAVLLRRLLLTARRARRDRAAVRPPSRGLRAAAGLRQRVCLHLGNLAIARAVPHVCTRNASGTNENPTHRQRTHTTQRDA